MSIKNTAVLNNPLCYAYLLSFLYWGYLLSSSQMIIAYDSINYEMMGQLLARGHWVEYFKNGPNREPLYSLVISMTMRLSEVCGISYQIILKFVQVVILFLTQGLTLRLLRKIHVHPHIEAVTILYIGISPALVNSAFSMYSEIMTYPFILGVILLSASAWQMLGKENNMRRIPVYGLALAVFFILLTLTKAIFEAIFPIFLFPFFYLAIRWLIKKDKKKLIKTAGFLLLTILVYYAAILGYKSLNEKYNGNFVLTDRGAWPLYGNTSRRMDNLTTRKFLTALAYMPGEGLCRKLFKEKECWYWSYRESDNRGMTKLNELTQLGLSGEQINRELVTLSMKEILKNPFQYLFFMLVETLKMFFWESTQIGWVVYPPWLTQLFGLAYFKNLLRLGLFIVSLFSFLLITVQLLKKKRSRPSEEKVVLYFVIFLIILFIGVHSFFFTLTRYSLPIAPLFLILIATAFHNILSIKNPGRTG